MAVHPETVELLSPVPVADDSSKKVRKPYTITKSRESWTEQEHDKFLEALQLFDRDWKKIEAFVGSKTVIQIRSHAQKYFLKVQKNGTGEHVPPPRPKRKATQPYPQKASKTAAVSQVEPMHVVAVQSSPATPSISTVSTMPAWIHHMTPPGNLAHVRKGVGPVDLKNQMAKTGESSSRPSPQLLPIGQKDGVIVLRAMPDFAEVYSFLGNVFDPVMDGHLERMQEMTPIDRETVLLLMRNLSINLSSSDFEEHKLFLSVYDMDTEDALPPLNCNTGSDTAVPVVSSQAVLENGDGFVSGSVTDGIELSVGMDDIPRCCTPDELENMPLHCDCDKENFANDAGDGSSESLLIEGKSFLEQCLLGTSTIDCSTPRTQDEFRPQDSSEGAVI